MLNTSNNSNHNQVRSSPQNNTDQISQAEDVITGGVELQEVGTSNLIRHRIIRTLEKIFVLNQKLHANHIIEITGGANITRVLEFSLDSKDTINWIIQRIRMDENEHMPINPKDITNFYYIEKNTLEATELLIQKNEEFNLTDMNFEKFIHMKERVMNYILQEMVFDLDELYTHLNDQAEIIGKIEKFNNLKTNAHFEWEINENFNQMSELEFLKVLKILINQISKIQKQKLESLHSLEKQVCHSNYREQQVIRSVQEAIRNGVQEAITTTASTRVQDDITTTASTRVQETIPEDSKFSLLKWFKNNWIPIASVITLIATIITCGFTAYGAIKGTKK